MFLPKNAAWVRRSQGNVNTMKTASHYTFSGAGRISISIGYPRGAPAGYKIFKALAPTRDLLKVQDQAKYEARYRAEILGKLDPQGTWDTLHGLAGGAEPVIQCFEKPPFHRDNWCHRRMVAAWFKETLGHDVPELGCEHVGDGSGMASEADRPAKRRGQGQLLQLRHRPEVEAMRTLIDRYWEKVCRSLGLRRDWSWSGLPNHVRDRMGAEDLDEWDALQERYRDADTRR